MRFIITIIISLIPFLGFSAYPEQVSAPITAHVTWVTDGDTFKCRSGGVEYVVRFWGIDAPEKYITDPKTKKRIKNPLGDMAHKYLIKLLHNKNVKLYIIGKPTGGPYGRMIAKVYLGRKYVNLDLIKTGHAAWSKKYAPHEKDFAEAEKQAKSQHLGIWSNQAKSATEQQQKKSRA